ncbi:hypothetical protein [Pontibacter litorisediminis]|uniref:hypothetical protein n=1 Tax=Pontibacter litorisediminis TaxID=1846260 RepID=UPI0023EE2415|nr:hypothetical protein [Pontibacter litorisediminis]
MKKVNLSILAVLLGSALAFAGTTTVRSTEASALQWFQLQTGGDPDNPDHYTLVDAPENCGEGEKRCAIYAEEDMQDPGKPTQSGVDNPILEELRDK